MTRHCVYIPPALKKGFILQSTPRSYISCTNQDLTMNSKFIMLLVGMLALCVDSGLVAKDTRDFAVDSGMVSRDTDDIDAVMSEINSVLALILETLEKVQTTPTGRKQWIK